MSNPNQEIIESRLATYVDGELDANERLEIEQHLQQNPQYRRVIDDLRKQREMLRGLPREAAPPDLAEAFTNQLERSVLLDGDGNKNARRMRIYALPRMVAAAAIVLLTVGLAGIVYFVLPDRTVRNVAVSPTGPRAIEPAPASPRGDASSDDKIADSLPDNKPSMAKAPSEDGIAQTIAPEASVPADAPDAAAKSSATIVEKNAAPEEYAAGSFRLQNRALADGLRRGQRDAELDQLAENVSKDPQVRELLGGKSDAKPQAGVIERPVSENARVVVVRASDPRQLQDELAKFFSQGNIDWTPAPPRVELALNTSLSQQNDEAIQTDRAANRREIDLKAVEPRRVLTEAAKQSTSAKAIAPLTVSPAPGAAQAPGNMDANRKRDLAGTSFDAAPGSAGASGGGQGGSANGMSATPANVIDDSVLKENASLQEANVTAEKKKLSLNPAPVENMYVARRLSNRQAEELNTFLASQGEVRPMGVDRRLGQYQYASNDLIATDKGAAVNPVAAAPIQQGQEQPQPVHAVRAAAASQSMLTVPPGKDRTDGAARELRKAQVPAGVQSTGQRAADLQQFRAVAGAPIAMPTTQPAPAIDEPEGMVDVVIVVQKQPGTFDTIAAPSNSIPGISPAPVAARAASATSPTPSTRPASPAK